MKNITITACLALCLVLIAQTINTVSASTPQKPNQLEKSPSQKGSPRSGSSNKPDVAVSNSDSQNVGYTYIMSPLTNGFLKQLCNNVNDAKLQFIRTILPSVDPRQFLEQLKRSLPDGPEHDDSAFIFAKPTPYDLSGVRRSRYSESGRNDDNDDNGDLYND